MADSPDDRRLELFQGTLDMLILRTLQWGPQHGHGVGQAIRTQSDDLLKVETGSLYPALLLVLLLMFYWLARVLFTERRRRANNSFTPNPLRGSVEFGESLI